MSDHPLTLDMVKSEHARKVAAGDFENAQSLAGRWANPELNLSEEELRAGIKAFANEWEHELDDYKPESSLNDVENMATAIEEER